MSKLLFVIGTRPEIIKVAPVIMKLKELNFKDYKIVNSGQHSELIKPYWDIFDIQPDYELDIIEPNQRLSQLTSTGIRKFDELLCQFEDKEKPEYIIAQGDTTTVMISAMVAFYHQIKFAHIEAGLRTADLFHPFPEEYNRKIVAISAGVNFIPTKRAMQNLVNEGIEENRLHLVGNTIVDAVNFFKSDENLDTVKFKDSRLDAVSDGERNLVLITCHRRENHDFIEQIIEAISELAQAHSDLRFIWPVHANPRVKKPVQNSSLSTQANVFITDPLDYLELMNLMKNTVKIITDSGGIQEEAPSFGIPVIVLREVTERQEAIESGLACLVGNDKNKIIEGFNDFKMKEGVTNPFGDGHSAERIANYLITN